MNLWGVSARSITGSVDVHVRVRGFDDRDAFRRRDDAGDAHVAGASLRQAVQCGH